MLVSVQPPMEGERVPCDICCVIDISGSMGSDATLKSTAGDVESYGLSILDIVKHAVKTIIEVMGPNDRLSIVTFSDTARIDFPLSQMSNDGKKTAVCVLEELVPEMSTNLWAGLNMGLEVLLAEKQWNRFSTVFLLTDGEPNIIPPRGELAMLQQYKSKTGLPASVSTFGFGYKLNSKLLQQLATEGNGVYAFIPDSSITGTVFVNALSNTLSSCATDVNLTINFEAPFGTVVGNFPKTTTQNSVTVNLGSLKYGQRRDIVIDLQKIFSPPKSLSLVYFFTPKGLREECTLSEYNNRADSPNPLVHYYRLRLTQLFANIDSPPTKSETEQFAAQIEKSLVSQDPFIQDLLKDINGQIMEGIAVDAFNRWGKHFIPSLCGAHLLQQCNNFKDPGVQHYGGNLFKSVRDVADELFLKLPPPTPSVKKTKVTYTKPVKTTKSKNNKLLFKKGKTKPPSPVVSAPWVPAPVNMSAYYNASGGCIWSEGDVLMQDNSVKKVKDIRKGDFIKTVNGESVQVLCVTKTTLNPRDKTPLVQLEGGLVLTPWHPVFVNNHWAFPCQIGKLWEANYITRDVFNFVLEKGHVIIVNGIECVTLGHGFMEEVVKHDYYGTQEVINDLRTLPGWENGYIDLNGVTIRRDSDSGLVSGYMIN